MLVTKQNNKINLHIIAEYVDVVPISKSKLLAHIVFVKPKDLTEAICFSLDNIEIETLIKRIKKHIGE